MMDKEFNKEDWSLHKCNLKVFEGLIFINLSKKANDFNEFISPTKKFIEFHGLSDAKIAHRQFYPTDGNWKLTLDNFHECYHCQPSHPEYCSVHDKEYISSSAFRSGNASTFRSISIFSGHKPLFSGRFASWLSEAVSIGSINVRSSLNVSAIISANAKRLNKSRPP